MKNSILPDMSDVLLLMSDIERQTNCPVHVLEMYRSVAPPPSPVVSKLIIVILSFCQTLMTQALFVKFKPCLI